MSGGLLGALALVIVVAELSRSRPNDGGIADADTLGSAANVDLSTMTPREAADLLFNRVMGAFAQNDSAQGTLFLPMALGAYELARPLDADGLFHLSLLQAAGEDPDTALATALEGLGENPGHLLNLYAAAQAAQDMGDLEAARGYYSTILEEWDREVAAGREEYLEHETLLPMIRQGAEGFLGGAIP